MRGILYVNYMYMYVCCIRSGSFFSKMITTYICSVGGWPWTALLLLEVFLLLPALVSVGGSSKTIISNFQFNPLKLLHCLFCCSKWRRISGYYDGGYMKKWPRKEETTCIFCWKISGHSCQQLHIFVKEISKQRCKLDLLLQYVYARKSFICNVTTNQ